jgi:electron transfer flavoprotein alpha subunit
MDFIVLVKQVPDITNIPEEAWDRKRGTLRRGLLDNVPNPLDLHALTLAYRIKEKWPSRESRILALTMGPLQAKEVLADALSRGADDAVLLTDGAFAGADTAATAYSLALAIRKIETEILKKREYIIVCGMQSVDGDTAQVPAQIAEALGIEHIAYAKSFSWDRGLVVNRIGPQGMEAAAPKEYPILITATAATEPLYRSFHRTREALQKKVHQWDAQAISADVNRIGLRGSRTQVYRIFSPSEERHKTCIYPDSLEKLVALLEKRCKEDPAEASTKSGVPYSIAGKTPSYRGEVWVYVEQERGVVKSVSLELISKAKELAASLEEKVGAILVGHNVEPLTDLLIAQGADKVYLAQHPLLEYFLPIPYKKTVSELVLQHKPQIMLVGATPLGRELAPRIAYSTDAGLTADCTKLEIGDFQKEGTARFAILKQTRPALGGNIMATIMTKDAHTQMATVRPGVLKALPPDPTRTGEIVYYYPDITEADIKTHVLSRESFAVRTDIADARIIVSGGRGLGSKANYDKCIRSLAEAIHGFLEGRIDVGASRMAVEEGFVGHDHQVGQTGQTVRPKLYIAVAISGAVQHISGMQNSEIVVAINKDPRARIFNYADFGVVGDFEAVVPELIEAIHRRKKS